MEKQEKRNFNGKKYRGKQTDSNKGKKSGEMKKPVQKQKSVCPVFEKCGGCQLLDVPYEKQVKKKGWWPMTMPRWNSVPAASR